MKNDVVILGAKPYDFEDKATGKQVSGVTVWVLPLEQEDGTNGFLPVKYSLTHEQYSKIAQQKLPAHATLELTYNLASKRVKFHAFDDLESATIA